ncbi:protein-glutamine gamma-glutamyltransferase E [Cololabis saira]|uniref:protein-glutamine gamma-glutamyltransferase E n=1 Tax=Cololabis saira TaxID=129043 RepID=UPI002AD34D9B|nr:protein-glutamine gamma-glutamyltransferase E [Cololabis saira]
MLVSFCFPPVFMELDLHCQTNNAEHHTHEISRDELIVRRGQAFAMTVKLSEPFNSDLHQLSITVQTGQHPSEDLGTMSRFGIPDAPRRSPSAKAVWRAELHRSSSPRTGLLTLTVTPPADAPIGEYRLSMKYKEEEEMLEKLTVLFNPWCPDDWVFLSDKDQKQEYVMNEQGILYRGSGPYISPMDWDYGQFEDDMVKICLRMLDVNNKHLRDPAGDVSARCNPIYVSRVVSAMINSVDDHGVVQGNWGGNYWGGVSPSHWSGSYPILKKWFQSNCRPVKFGQCWVFAGVMCSVMRLLGIPCRVVSNFQSAHDTDRNLTIDVYYADYGVRERDSKDSIWNFHVWVEGWMRRPDLGTDSSYDGWQVLDPTPQETSGGVYRCGPAPVAAIRNGDTHLKYDIPFVFAEVNADCVYWLEKPDGSMMNIFSETMKVGQNISTKSVGSNKRNNITDEYKYKEGTEQERDVFKHAVDGLENGCSESHPHDITVCVPTTPKPSVQIQDVSEPVNGKDVNLMLVVTSENTVAKQLSINISVQAMRYNGSPAGNIQTETTEQTLQPGKELSVPILVPFSSYHKLMRDCESMNISALVSYKDDPEGVYLAEKRVVLKDPPISVSVTSESRVNLTTSAEMVFMNPIDETLRNCTLTFSGSGIFRGEVVSKLPNLPPNCRIRVKFSFVPYKSGERTLLVDLDCSSFRDLKASCVVNVKP